MSETIQRTKLYEDVTERMLDHIRTGRIAQGETVVFWHTGGATALFAEQQILGKLY